MAKIIVKSGYIKSITHAANLIDYAGHKLEAQELYLEDGSVRKISDEKYVEYIATRPSVQFGENKRHGLFTDKGVPVVLEQAAREVSEHQGNVWTHIISLRREDAERLGYNSVEQWQKLLWANRNTIAENMKIKPQNFHWYAAFHNADHHPHVVRPEVT